MNNFTKYLNKLKELDLPLGKYAIFGSGPIAVRNLRDSRDLDVIVDLDVFNSYKNNKEWKYIIYEREGRKIEMLEKDGIEFYKSWGPGDWDVKQLIRESEIINGFSFVRLKEVVKWKKISNRDKDRKDIKIIEEFLKK